MVSSGVRDHIRHLVQHKLVSGIVSTAGGIEEDLIKCLAPTYLGSFHTWKGHELRNKACNRIGNLLIPNQNYCIFEDWIMPILNKMLIEQDEQKISWTASRLIERLGKEIHDETSIYYWCAKNNIPVYCSAITDGSLGDMLYIHAIKNSPKALAIDLVADTYHRTKAYNGCIILGGGAVKDQLLNADHQFKHVVSIDTTTEFDDAHPTHTRVNILFFCFSMMTCKYSIILI